MKRGVMILVLFAAWSLTACGPSAGQTESAIPVFETGFRFSKLASTRRPGHWSRRGSSMKVSSRMRSPWTMITR